MSGGLIAKGHPVGATGVAMLGSCFRQLKGKASKEIQRQDPKMAATFNIGGAMCAFSVYRAAKPGMSWRSAQGGDQCDRGGDRRDAADARHSRDTGENCKHLIFGCPRTNLYSAGQEYSSSFFGV